MLEFQLGVEEDPVVPFVAEIDDGSQEVELIQLSGSRSVIPLVGKVLKNDLSIAADRDSLVDAINLGCARGETVLPGRRLFFGYIAELQLLQFLGQNLDLALELVYLLFGRVLALRLRDLAVRFRLLGPPRRSQ